MLGSSRTYYGLEAERLDAPLSQQTGRPVSVVNFGFPGGGPLSELLTWRRLRRDGVRPNLVLIEVFPAFLSSTFLVDDAREERMPVDRLRWHDLSMLERYGTGRARPGLRRDFMEAEAVPLYSHRLTILNVVAPRLIGSVKVKNPLIERLSPEPFPAVLPRQVRQKVLDLRVRDIRPFSTTFTLAAATATLCASCWLHVGGRAYRLPWC